MCEISVINREEERKYNNNEENFALTFALLLPWHFFPSTPTPHSQLDIVLLLPILYFLLLFFVLYWTYTTLFPVQAMTPSLLLPLSLSLLHYSSSLFFSCCSGLPTFTFHGLPSTFTQNERALLFNSPHRDITACCLRVLSLFYL